MYIGIGNKIRLTNLRTEGTIFWQCRFKVLENDNMSDEVRTATTLSQIADMLDPNTRFTWDSPEMNSNNRIPVLNLKL